MRIATALLALLLCACSSQSTTEYRPVTDSGGVDGRRQGRPFPDKANDDLR